MNQTIGRSGFIAYPSDPEDIGKCIEAGVLLAQTNKTQFGTWRSLSIGGQLIPVEVHEGIASSSVFVADISYLNLNVAYEVGLAIGRGTPIVFTKNATLTGNHSLAPGLGIFDTIGHDTYDNATGFASILQRASSRRAIVVEYPLNPGMPAYTLLPKAKNDFILRVTSRLKRLKLTYRVFDGGEQSRLTANEAIQKVSESYGLVLALLPSSHPESLIHNLRTMFVAGLAVGMEKPLALLTSGIEPIPMDVADLAIECRFPEQIDEAVQDLATDVTEAFQHTVYHEGKPKTQLERLDLGASSAENELSKLDAYYLATDAFQKTLRGEARLVVGRKGSGKSAIFYQLKQKLSQIKQKLVIDLKPDGFQLISLKESLAPVLSAGALEHLITSFWEYVLFCEIGAQFLRDMRLVSRRDPELGAVYRELEDLFDKHRLTAEGDFSERIVSSLKRIEEEVSMLAAVRSDNEKIGLTSPQVTALVHKGLLSEIETTLHRCLRYKEEVWILFDNIDKGWPAHGLTPTDIMVVRTLQDATRKVARTLDRQRHTCYTMIFLRNDVVELLISETPDRGKEARVMLDWTDPEALKELVRRRLAFSGLPQDRSLEELWRQIATPFVMGAPSFDYLLDRCLMRPRFLLDLIGHCKSAAVNVGHQRIEVEDIEKGLKTFSSDLVMDIGFEIADVLGHKDSDADQLLMRFIKSDQILTEEEVLAILLGPDQNAPDRERVLKILLWHGVIGIDGTNGDGAQYIYHFNYNYPLMEATVSKAREQGNLRFKINDAFSIGLQLATTSENSFSLPF